MIWSLVRKTFEDYFPRDSFSFDIIHAEEPSETECNAVLKIGKGPREQRMSIFLESEDNVKYLRVLSPVVPVDKCSPDQLLRLMEQNLYWVSTRVGQSKGQIVFTTLVTVREFEADPAALGDSMSLLAKRADQMETLLFGKDFS